MFQRVCMRMSACIAAAVTALAASGCAGSGPQDQGVVPPELRLEGVRFRVYRGDLLRAFGEARTSSLRRDSTELKATELEATLPRAGSAPVRITAPTGHGTIASQRFEASGGVVVARGTDAARTERARYEPAEEGDEGDGLVRGDDPVTVTGSGYRLTGNGFVLDPADGTIVVRGRASLAAGLPGGR
jgi:lipopolysaccharide export system protein LptC